MDQTNFAEVSDKYFHVFINYLPKIIGAILILLLGLWLIKIFIKYLNKLFIARHYEESLRRFLLRTVDIGLKIILVITVIAKLGIQTTSFVAIFGAISLAIGMALQGSLANFAGGVIIILLKPFKIGDWISADGVSGSVKEISIFYTKIINANNLLVLVPNAELSNKKVQNFTVEGIRKDIIKIRVAYGTDIKDARKVLLDLVNRQEGVFKDSAVVQVEELAENYIALSVIFVSSVSDFWKIHYNILEHAEQSLNAVGIRIAYPQYDINLKNAEEQIN